MMGWRVGVIPVPVFVLLLAAIGYFIASGKLPTEINMMLAVLAVGGFACAEIGHRLPVINQIGGAAIFATFVPSYLAFHRLLPPQITQNVTDFTKSTNFLYLFIAAVIVGSILSMDRRVLIQGFLKLFVPMAAGSLAALLVGALVGGLLGLGVRHTLLMILVPVLAGGVGEGGHSAIDRLCADLAPATGRAVRAGAAAGDVRQFDGHIAVRRDEPDRPSPASPDGRRAIAGRRTR